MPWEGVPLVINTLGFMINGPNEVFEKLIDVEAGDYSIGGKGHEGPYSMNTWGAI